MFNFICTTLPHVRTSPFHKLLSSSTLNCISNSSNEHSLTVSYLINSCGFTPERALLASNRMNFKTLDKPDSVLSLFKNHGFTETQISNLIKRYPRILLYDPQKTLLPKLHFFNSIGLSSTDLAQIITATPNLLTRSLGNRLIPSFNFLKSLLQSQEKAVAAIKRFTMLLGYGVQTHVAPNIEILREFGVPEANIVYLLTNQPRAFMADNEKFKRIVEEVKKMGFNPLKLKFVVGIHALRSMSKLTWEKKVEVYKKWGLSEDEISVAFVKNPWCMMASESKITGVMDFLVNKMGWESSVIARRPIIISLSLLKRTVPRCSVYQVLLTKGLVKKDCGLLKMLQCTEENFVANIKMRYEEEAPELLKLLCGTNILAINV